MSRSSDIYLKERYPRCPTHWFNIKQMAANPAKFQVMFLGTKITVNNFLINDVWIPVTDSVKLLGITIDKKTQFQE